MSTYSSLHFHLVFGTKNREPWIEPNWRARLHEYMGGTVRSLGGVSQGIGGTADHVHVLVSLKPTHCIADFVRDLKRAATAWIHDNTPWAGFGWQDGYGVFSVSPSGIEGVQHYIARQEEHHRVKGFREEFEGMLKKAGISYDPKWLP